MVGMIGPNILGSVQRGPNLLGSVQREPKWVRSKLNVLFPQLGLTASLVDVRYRTNPIGITGQLVLGKDLYKVFSLVNTGPVSPSTDLLMMYRVLLGTD